MLITSSIAVDLIIFFTTIGFLLYKYVTRKFDFWTKLGVPHLQPKPFIGNMQDVVTRKMTITEFMGKLYKSMDEPFFGVFLFDEPYLIIKSPQLIKQVLIKDFNTFMDRSFIAAENNDISKHTLILQKGEEWKQMRSKMTPAFTSGKLKNLMPYINNCAKDMVEYIEKQPSNDLEAKELCCKYTTDVIAITAFGIEANCFKFEDATFRKVGRAIFQPTLRNSICQFIFLVAPHWANFLKLDFVERWTTNFLSEVFWQTVKTREKNNTRRDDVIDLIVQIRKDKELCKKLKFEGGKVVAQAVQFFNAGFETSATALSFTLYELCINKDIQDKLRSEINEIVKQNNGEVTFEAIQKMKYMDMCIFETLRKYPVLPFLDRRAIADYQIPGTHITIPKGTPLFVPLLGLHHDEQYFPEPEKYDPERMTDKSTINSGGAVFLPFGEGPRTCIGERLAMLKVKIALVHLLREYELVKSKETPVPIEFNPRVFIYTSKVGLPMSFVKI